MEKMTEIKLQNKIAELEKKLNRIEDVKQIPQTASLASVIDTINKITDNMKRNR